MKLALVALAACAHPPAPRDPDPRALFRDLERVVTITATMGWALKAMVVRSSYACYTIV